MTSALLLTGADLVGWGTDFRAGRAPSALPYGIDVLAARGWRFAGGGVTLPAPLRKPVAALEHRKHLEISRAVAHAGLARSADVTVALLEREGELYGRLRGHGIPPYARTPLVVWSCWLADDARRADARTRQRMRRWLRGVDLVTHLSRHETGTLVDLGIAPERLFPVTYGVSHRFYTPDPTVTQDIAVLAVGQDRGRDYPTLVEAVRGTDLTLDLVTRPENLRGLSLPDNVRMHGMVPLTTYRQMLRRARIVAVPTREMAYPTGSSVALEAAATGATVVVTGTRAMRDYFSDDINAVLVPEGDVQAWRDTLTQLSQDTDRRARLGRGARANVVDRFNADVMWTELADVLAARGIVG